MSTDNQPHKVERSVLSSGRENPNFPEVSGTTLPLLATVLAGFAVTIVVQLIMMDGTLPNRIVIAVAALLLSTLLLLSATVFAVNAQANNYLPFLEMGRDALRRIEVDDFNEWLIGLRRRWLIYHRAATTTFYAGVLLLLTAIALVVWVFAGLNLAAIFTAAVVVSLALNVGVGVFADRRA